MLPSQDIQRTLLPTPRKIPRGLDALYNGMLGKWESRRLNIRDLRSEAASILDAAAALQSQSDNQLRSRINTLKKEIRRHRDHPSDYLHRALPLLIEIAHRRLHLWAYPSQVMGALALSRGYLTEMATGEGKTLTIALASVLSGWTRNPVHVITANDYLAERDAQRLQAYYAFCSIDVGHVTGAMPTAERREQYLNDVVYTTAKEILADFLRDRIALGPLQNSDRRLIRSLLGVSAVWDQHTVMRGIHTAIVDEADSLLIDEAVTPLIISRIQDNPYLVEGCRLASETADGMEQGIHYEVELFYKEIQWKPVGQEQIRERSQSLKGLYRNTSWFQELVEQALKARLFYLRDKHYVVKDDQVVIVDEFTGRLMPGRQWRQGLHQAVEAKEGVPITQPAETLSSLSFQTFFRLFRNLSGITGTAREARGEFWQIYEMPWIAIPRNRPRVQTRLPDLVFLTSREKWVAIADEISAVHQTGRPILVGTRTVQQSEHLAELLQSRGLTFRILNAVRHRHEAMIISMAGEEANITIATNMAGRGTDIKLGDGVARRGGLHVIVTEMHAARRIDRQLFGRSSRQGDPGSIRVYLSLDDEILKNFTPKWAHQWLSTYCRSPLPGKCTLVQIAMLRAQRAAERFSFLQRKNVLRQDDWIQESFSNGGNQLPI